METVIAALKAALVDRMLSKVHAYMYGFDSKPEWQLHKIYASLYALENFDLTEDGCDIDLTCYYERYV